RLARPAPDAADATLTATPLALFGLLRDADDTLRSGAVQIDGDAEIAQRFYTLARLLRPDIEEALAGLLGDVPAHELARIGRYALAYGAQVARTSIRNAAEYLAYETRDLVPRPEADAFFRDVERLRDDTERLAARLRLLESPPPETE
ncbi:MAG: hypothetical protein RML32_07235, partial [Gammaproteobacteria bacterium]|nr:hypothetical protein [Gammaproteobacteria bacterium]